MPEIRWDEAVGPARIDAEEYRRLTEMARTAYARAAIGGGGGGGYATGTIRPVTVARTTAPAQARPMYALGEPEEGEMPREVRGRNLPDICYFKDTISQLFNKRSYSKKKEDAVVGIEIEQETKLPFNLPELVGWTRHNEGSLRDFGFEYVLSPPKQLKAAEKLVDALYSSLPVADLSSSIRTSVHVHFDVTQYQFQDLATLACVYWLCEPLLTEYAGSTRKGNLFCLRAEESNYTQKLMSLALRDGNPRDSRLYSEQTRYASLNFASVAKFGSIETRLMRGTADPEVVKFWVNAVNELRLFALKFNSPREFLSFFFDKKNPAESFYSSVFSESTLKVLKNSCKVSEKDLILSLRNVASSLYCIYAARENYNTEEEAKSVEEAYLKQLAEEEKQLAELRARQAQINARLTRTFGFYGLTPDLDNIENLNNTAHEEVGEF